MNRIGLRILVHLTRRDVYHHGSRSRLVSGKTSFALLAGVNPNSEATALVKAMVRAHRWRHMLESGEYTSSAELAKAEKVNDSYLSRILRLTLIAPDITEAILAGRQPSTLQLDDLLKPLPSAWAKQHSVLFDPD